METVNLLQTLLAFAFVLGLIWSTAWLMRKSGLPERLARAGLAGKRLGVSETLYLDPKRKLLLVRRDDKEHLLLLGPQGEAVVETGITPPGEKKEFTDA